MTLYFELTGKSRKRKRSAPESSDTSEKESEEPLRKSRCLFMETNEPQAEGEIEDVFYLSERKKFSFICIVHWGIQKWFVVVVLLKYRAETSGAQTLNPKP